MSLTKDEPPEQPSSPMKVSINIASMIIKDRLDNGKTIDIPSLGITIGKRKK